MSHRPVPLGQLLVLPVALVAVSRAGTPDGGADATTPSPAAEHERLVAALVEEYRGRGFEIDAEGLGVELGERDSARAFIEKQQDDLFPDGHFEATRVFVRYLGLRVPPDPDRLRSLGAEAIADVLQAYYRYDEKKLVFLDSELTALVGIEPLVAHELAHAWRDQRTPIADLLRDVPTLEAARILECLLEGEAELLSIDLLLARTGIALDSIDMESFDSKIGRMQAGVFDLAYAKGREFLHAVWLEGGWEAVQACFGSRPTSSEQVVHPSKLGVDLPRAVELPAWPDTPVGATERLHLDVIGELGIYRALVGAGVSEAEAYPAAVGWDGDRMATYRMADGHDALVWRSVWDRERDAEQFAAVLEEHARGQVAVRGRVVDAVWAGEGLLELELLEHLAAHPLEAPAVEADEVGTAAIEDAWLDATSGDPRVEGDTWIFPRLGLRVPIPEGFEVEEVNGMGILTERTADRGLRNNVNVIELPNLSGADLREALDANRRFVERSEALELISAGIDELDGVEVVRLEYRGELYGLDMLFLAVLGVGEDHMWIATATGLEETWEEKGAVLRAILDGIRFDAALH